MSKQIPPQLQNQLIRLQEQQEQYKALLLRKQQFEMELKEVERALQECSNLPDNAIIYKSVGTLLFKTEKSKIVSELNEKKEELDLRIKTIEKQEQRLRQQLEELRKSIQASLSGTFTGSWENLDFSLEKVKEACEIGEQVARNYIYSRINPKFLRNLEISIIYEDLSFTVDIFIEVLPTININIEEIIEEATNKALLEIDKFIRGNHPCQT